MAVIFLMHPWLTFTSGTIAGCWAGVILGGGLALLFASRRIRKLERANLLLRVKLQARQKVQQAGAAGPVLVGTAAVRSPRETQQPASQPARLAGGKRTKFRIS